MIKLELTLDEVNFILSALVKKPYDEAAAVIDKVRTQAISQVEKPEASQENALQTEAPQ